MKPFALLFLVVFFVQCFAVAPLHAQTTPPPGSELRVYVLTMGPGDDVWEKFGHNALRIVDPGHNIDESFNWGVFEFGPGFITKFLKFDLIYWMEHYPTQPMLRYYIKANRAIYQQELNLLPKQKLELFNAVMQNARPENKYYPYDYYRNNCSTKLRDAIDRAMNGHLHLRLQKTTQSTYRSLTRIAAADDPAIYLALDFILGHPTDRALNAWEESFIPEKFRQHLKTIVVLNENGQPVPLVKSELLINGSSRPDLSEKPPVFWPWYLLIGIALGLLLALLGRLAERSRLARWGFIFLVIPWLLLIGFGGTFGLGMWFFTKHWSVAWNENFLLATPLALILMVLVPFATAGKAWSIKPVRWLALAMLALGLLELLGKTLPAFNQANWEFISLFLPANLGLMMAAWTFAPRVQPARKGKIK